jgi:MoxR-like ATPase
LAKIMDGPRILELRDVLEKVVVADPVRDFAVRLVLATHPQAVEAGDAVRRFVKWGASPRAVQALVRAARVRALADGRAHVAFEDIRHFAPEVLGHRVLLNYDGLAENLSVPELVTETARLVPEEAAA